MAEQKLNLFQFASSAVVELRIGPAAVMGSNVSESDLGAMTTYYVTDDVLTDTSFPYRSVLADRSEQSPAGDPRCCRPAVQGLFDPLRYRDGANMATFAHDADRSRAARPKSRYLSVHAAPYQVL